MFASITLGWNKDVLKESGKMDSGREFQTLAMEGIKDSLCRDKWSLDSLTQKLCEDTACRVLRGRGRGGGIMVFSSCEQNPKYNL